MDGFYFIIILCDFSTMNTLKNNRRIRCTLDNSSYLDGTPHYMTRFIITKNEYMSFSYPINYSAMVIEETLSNGPAMDRQHYCHRTLRHQQLGQRYWQ
jgi:hypothetical protein